MAGREVHSGDRDDVAADFLRSARARFASLKTLGERALARLDDKEMAASLDPESNSVSVLVQHIAGNMRSRWTDFLTSDGEKPDRNRDAEFEPAPGAAKKLLMPRWEDGWRCLFAALDGLKPKDLGRTVFIRGEAHTVVDAINRQLVHYGQHVGQIVFLAKHLKWGTWESLSMPRRRPAGGLSGPEPARPSSPPRESAAARRRARRRPPASRGPRGRASRRRRGPRR